MENQGGKKNNGHGPGAGTFGVKGKVANTCPKTPGNFGTPAKKVKAGSNGKG